MKLNCMSSLVMVLTDPRVAPAASARSAAVGCGLSQTSIQPQCARPCEEKSFSRGKCRGLQPLAFSSGFVFSPMTFSFLDLNYSMFTMFTQV